MIDILLKDSTYFDGNFQLQHGDLAIQNGYFVTYRGEIHSKRVWLPGLVDNHVQDSIINGKFIMVD